MEIIFVTGKGGVGKSTIAAAIALAKAKTKKTLLVELGDQSFYKDFIDLSEIKYTPCRIEENLEVAIWSGSESFKEYALHLIKVPALYQLFFENPVSKALIQIAPGLSELSILGKITSGIRGVGPKLDYEVIIVDGYATGHFESLIRAPFGMAESIRIGPMADQSREMISVLRDKQICKYVVVALPEELPIIESLEIRKKVKDLLGQSATLILNKTLSLNELRENVDIENYKGQNIPSDFLRYLSSIYKRQENIYSKLSAENCDFIKIPFQFSVDNWQTLNQISTQFLDGFE